MRLYKHQFKPMWIIKNALLCLGILASGACGLLGGGGPNEHHYSFNNGGGGNFEDVNEQLDLAPGSQLYSLKSGDNKASNKLATKSSSSGEASADEEEGLLILDTKGKGKRFLKKVKFENLQLVKDGQKNAYVACMDFKSTFKYNLKNQWLIIKDGQKVIPIEPRKDGVYSGCSMGLVGQTETAGYLVFRDGSLIDLDGKRLDWADFSEKRNLKNVTQADYVSGDIVAISRKVSGTQVSSIANLITKKRKSYSDYWTPNFVEIAGGQGLISDTRKGFSSVAGQSNITKLEEEIVEGPTTRAGALQNTQIGKCLWFNSSTRVAASNAAILLCYVAKDDHNDDKSYHRLKWVELKLGTYEVTEITEISNDDQSGIHHNGRSQFINGDGFTVMRLANDALVISHATKTVVEKITPNLQSIFDIRINEDKKSFHIVGEDNDGSLYMENYHGDGTAGERLEIIVH